MIFCANIVFNTIFENVFHSNIRFSNFSYFSKKHEWTYRNLWKFIDIRFSNRVNGIWKQFTILSKFL